MRIVSIPIGTESILLNFTVKKYITWKTQKRNEIIIIILRIMKFLMANQKIPAKKRYSKNVKD
jgi:hypothetical protein